MRKYVYENATVYITKPTDKQLENIRKATERFAQRLAKERLIGNEQRRNNNRASGASPHARKRVKKVKA